jgi:hypothetical protein
VTELTETQLAALRAYAARGGRYWKSRLIQAWLNGALRGDDAPALQEIRNTRGPAWLLKFKLPE